MYTPKLRPQIATCEITKQGRSNDEDTSGCCSVRWCLIIWAFLRLVVSVLWTSLIILKTVGDYKYRRPLFSLEDPFVEFGIIATIAQLVEFGMLVTFIVAGIKRSANLYRSYYRYCILTLIIYVIAVTLCLTLDYYDGHFFGEIYLTYHMNDFAIQFTENDALVFVVAASLDICLELVLIHFVKKLINKYTYNENYMTGENI